MGLNDRSTAEPPANPPPSYTQSHAQPPRNEPVHVEVAHAVALYKYSDPDPRDLNFEPGDHISVMEMLNPEWWMGKNVRTGEEGIFPKSYVRQENYPSPLAPPPSQSPAGFYGRDNKGPAYGQPQQQQQNMGGYYPGQQQQQQQYAPGPSDPYQGPVPPMQIAAQPTEQQPGKGAEMGKKFGKKLGNAAIFGAGATIGSNIVNSIF